MENDIGGLSCRYDNLQSSHQILGLVTAAFNLTLEYRGLHDALDAELRKKGNAFNEIQHKLLSQALSQLANKDRYPNDVFFAILGELAEIGDIQASVVASLSSALASVE